MAESTKHNTFTNEVGVVTRAKGYLLSIEGLPHAQVDDVLEDKDGKRALVISLNDEYLNALTLDPTSVRPGDRFTRMKSKKLFSFGEHLFGRVINALGDPLDDKSGFSTPNADFELDVVAKGLNHREHITEQFESGVTMVDTLFPIGKGQRQLIFGTIRSGKTTFLRDAVINQRERGTVCIYAAVGKPIDMVQRLSETLLDSEKGNPNAIILSAASNESSPMISIAPSIAFSLAEHFSTQGRDILLIIDDFGAHAKYLREIALLEGRLPGRESYPGDVFYQQAHLIERAGRFNEKSGGGSITLLPVLETDIQNTTDLIPTNLMSATDGHFSFSAARRAEGYYPSLLEDESVTRVGKNTQTLVQKQLATKVGALLADYKAQQTYSQFGAEVSEKTQKLLHQGALVKELLAQEPYANIPRATQVIFLSLAFTNLLMENELSFLQKNKQALLKVAEEHEGLASVREMALSDNTFDDFLATLDKSISVFESVCQY